MRIDSEIARSRGLPSRRRSPAGGSLVMLTIDDLRSSAVALDWHEAVAVAAALAGHVAAAPRTIGAPAPGDVLLLASGDLRVAGPGVIGNSPAQGVALVLSRLLETAPCPAELRQLVETYEDAEFAAREGAVVRLAASLAFFERPGRAEVLASLAERAEPALERARRDAALEELTERTRQTALAGARSAKAAPAPVAPSAPPVPVARTPVPPAAPTVAPPPDGPAPESAASRFLVPALGIVVFLGMAYAVASYFAPAPPAAARGADAPAPEEDLPVSGPGLDRAARRAGRAAAPAVVHKSGPAGSTAAAPAAPVAARPASPSAASAPSTAAPAEPPTATPVAPAPNPTGVDVVVAEKDGRVLSPATPPVRTAPRPPIGRVFTNSDPKVIPAVLLRPHLPDQPPAGVPEEQVGTLEFVVTETGAVEHVHLVSPANRYQERMLVAAAKTWQFQPATRDGHPVRFRTRIRVTL